MRHGVATMGSANANTGFLGAGYAHAGLLGMAIYGLLISGLLSFANVLQKQLGFAAAGAMTSHLFTSEFFASSDTPHAFMSYGSLARRRVVTEGVSTSSISREMYRSK